MSDRINQFEENYKLLISGNRLSKDNRVLNLDYIQEMIIYFEEDEQYEKCHNLVNIIKEITDHKLNYKWTTIN